IIDGVCQYVIGVKIVDECPDLGFQINFFLIQHNLTVTPSTSQNCTRVPVPCPLTENALLHLWEKCIQFMLHPLCEFLSRLRALYCEKPHDSRQHIYCHLCVWYRLSKFETIGKGDFWREF